MRIAAYIHFAVPKKLAGSEVMLHRLLAHLVAQGHEARVFVTDNPGPCDPPYVVDGVTIHEVSQSFAEQEASIRAWRPDLLVTHHNNARRVPELARPLGIPWILLLHNDFADALHVVNQNPDLVVPCSRWIVTQNPAFFHRKRVRVINPPVLADEHKATPGDCVTLINLNVNKGGKLFGWLAEKMPDVKFLGVTGAYAPQVLTESALPNLEVIPTTQDMRGDVWSRTKVLLMPSAYETYGTVGVEAMVSGIPTVAHPTPGLLESQSFAGTFVDRTDGQGWIDAIDSLLSNERVYRSASALASLRYGQLDPTDSFRVWTEEVEKLHERRA